MNSRRSVLNDLKGPTTVKHHDGSWFIIANGLLETYKQFVILYGEHIRPILFYKDDLDVAGYGHGVRAVCKSVIDGWYVYLKLYQWTRLHNPTFKAGISDNLSNIPDIVYVQRHEKKLDAVKALVWIRRVPHDKKLEMIRAFNGDSYSL